MFCTLLDETAKPRGDVWSSGLLDVTTCHSMDYIQCLYTADYRHHSKLRISHLSTQVILISSCNNNKIFRLAAYEEHRSVQNFFFVECPVPINDVFSILHFHFLYIWFYWYLGGIDKECNLSSSSCPVTPTLLVTPVVIFAIDICTWIIDDPDIECAGEIGKKI